MQNDIHNPTPEEISKLIEKAHQMRAEYVKHLFKSAWMGLKSGFTRVTPHRPLVTKH